MAKVAVVTHVREDNFFLAIWVKYYSSLVGAENCFVLLDGDDWNCTVDLSTVNVRVLDGRFRNRLKNDARWSQIYHHLMEELLADYDYVIRVDCDEYVCVDPMSEQTFEEVLAQADEFGYVNSLGVDVVQDASLEASLDFSKSIMSQRKFGFITKLYCKPNLLSKPLFVNAGGHRVRGERFRLSSGLIMLHLANIDKAMFEQRASSRINSSGAKTYSDQLNLRLKLFEVAASGLEAVDFDLAIKKIHQIVAKADGRKRFVNGNTVVFPYHKGFYVEFGDRFEGVL